MARTSTGKVTLDAVKRVLKLVTGAKGIRKKETTRGSNKGHGMYVLCRTGEERTSKVNARRGKA